MGAISGLVNWRSGVSGSSELTPVMDELQQSGADGGWTWNDQTATLGFQTTVPAAGEIGFLHHDSESGLTITADVRIDNREELCDKLAIPTGPKMSDTRLVLRAYQKWGEDCPDHLLGDFAFAIWDARRQQLFAARDLAGVRPFYYYSDDSRLVFASDLPAVAAAAGMSRQLNKMYSSGWAQRSILANDETAYAGIFRLPAAHVIVITRDKKRTWAWWTPDQVTELDLPDENQYAERLQQLLYQAVTCRVQAPCQVGAHLGGGLSSSSVAVIAARRLRSQGRELVAIHGLHKTAEEVPGDERQNVETICSQEGIDCHYAQPIDVYDAAFTRIRHSGDRPPGILLRERRVRETARQQGAHVLLTGLGGQGIVSNSGCFDEELLRGNLLGFWKMLRQYKQLRKGLTISFFIRKSMYGRRLRKLRKWVRSGFKAPSKPKPPIGLLNSPQVWQASFLDRQQPSSRAPQKSLGAGKVVGVRTAQIRKLTGLVSHLEGWTASGRQDQIEYRYPLLDRRVIEFALSIPGNLYLHNGFSKWIFRESLGGILPDSIRWHTGLGKPALQLDRTRINREFSRDLMQPLLRQLLTENWDWQCLDPQAARQIVEAAGRAELPDGSWWSAPLQALNVEMFFNHQLHESVSEQLQNRTIGKKVSRARAA